MKKMIAGFIAVLMILSGLPAISFAADAVYIIDHDTKDVDVPEFTSANFAESGVEGMPDGNKGSKNTAQPGYAVWQPQNLVSGTYKVSFWNVVRTDAQGGKDSDALVIVSHNGKEEEIHIDQTKNSGWLELGSFEFAGDGKEFVKLVRLAPKGEKDENDKVIFTHADAVKFERTDGNAATAESAKEPANAEEQPADEKVYLIDHDTKDADVPEFTAVNFAESGVEGMPGGNKGSRNTAQSGYAVWQPKYLAKGTYKVSFWNVVRTDAQGGKDKDALVIVSHNGKEEEIHIDQSKNSGWLELGIYEFAGNGKEFVKLVRLAPKSEKDENDKVIFTHADAVKFERTDGDTAFRAKTDEEIMAELPVDTSKVDKVYVKDFGAVPDDDKEDTPAIRNAIRRAVASGSGTTVVFEKGRYILDRDQSVTWAPFTFCFDFPDVDGLTFEGNETEFLIMDNFTGLFRFKNGKNLVFKGFTVDYNEIPFFQGIVKSVDPGEGSFILEPFEDNKLFEDPRMEACFNVAFGTVRDKERPILMKETAQWFFRLQKIEKAEGGYKVTVQDSYKSMVGDPLEIDVGDKIAFGNRGNNGSIFDIRQDGLGNFPENITVEDVTVYASPHAAMVITYNQGFLKVNNLKVIAKPGRNQWIVTNTDALFPQNARGAVEVTNSEFEGIMDDVISIHQKAGTLTEILAEDQISVTFDALTPLVGDTIEVYSRKEGEIKGRAVVIKREPAADASPIHKKAILTLDRPIKGMTVQDDANGIETDYILNRSTNERSYIANNIIKNTRGCGVFTTGIDSIIENNTFENIGTSLVQIHAATAYCVNDHIIISGNQAKRVGYLHVRLPAIRVHYEKPGTYYSAGEDIFYNDVIIKDNVIEGAVGKAYLLGNIENLRFLGENKIISYGEPIGKQPEVAIEIENCKNIAIDGLDLQDQRNGINGAVKIMGKYDKVLLGNNNIVVKDGDFVYDVDTERVENIEPIIVPAFEDIKGHWANETIRFMTLTGMVYGKSQTSFAPEDTITRAEFTALVVRGIGLEQKPYADAFRDVTKDDWYASVLQTAKDSGIIPDAIVENGEIHPNKEITREEMTAMIIKGFEAKTHLAARKGSLENFEDQDKISFCAKDYVASGVEMGLIYGITSDTFEPLGNATRAQATVMIKRLIDATIIR